MEVTSSSGLAPGYSIIHRWNLFFSHTSSSSSEVPYQPITQSWSRLEMLSRPSSEQKTWLTSQGQQCTTCWSFEMHVIRGTVHADCADHDDVYRQGDVSSYQFLTGARQTMPPRKKAFSIQLRLHHIYGIFTLIYFNLNSPSCNYYNHWINKNH